MQSKTKKGRDRAVVSGEQRGTGIFCFYLKRENVYPGEVCISLVCT